VGVDENLSGLRPVGRAGDALLLELVHDLRGTGEPDPKLPLQRRRAAELVVTTGSAAPRSAFAARSTAESASATGLADRTTP
jgi:hypothetical protein